MAPRYSFILVINIFLLSSFNGISAVNYEVFVDNPQYPGCIRFEKEIGIPFTKQVMAEVNEFIWSTVLKQTTAEDRKPVETVDITITENCLSLAVAVGEHINISAAFLNKYKGPPDLKTVFRAVVYHEMTHSFAWNGEGKAPMGVTEGIAEYAVLKAGLTGPFFVPPGAGDRWDQGYDKSARFFEYCETLYPDFVPKLNKMIRKTYDVSFFKEITGKSVEQLWADYKAKYPNVNTKTLTSMRALLMI